mmetsp:Transcript_16952/g.22406  ORF Transcript_16952/g.22406 Transcript_16952/m.22406 type:complete len:438 (+) Transcript_16952:85-1398(+)|eukprot:CAMPEP_0117740364 /NCGR_PEP_ID=MMETSP0947-20121206/4298_1 /TAXON_ID=44440 /ORGANISM="Chattonella subsalsa, Strain CCMP2191" /LENGTH=437 /DNA_ID=CAMNT_0005556465 /DNA_START=87 /DNA_END=1400 /DNA_ORIENTATION=+
MNPLFFLLVVSSISLSFALYGSNSDVIQISGNVDFREKVTKSDGIWLVEFYAPWCGHCKNLAPEWEKAASALKGVVNIAAVDATQDQSLAQKFGVQGYPTIKVFAADKRSPSDYQGQRTADAIIGEGLSQARKLVKDRQSGKKGKKSSSSSSGSGSGSERKKRSQKAVIELTDSTFDDEVLNSNDQWLVEFYAPWCGHCKNLAPEWAKAAEELQGQVKVAAVDATENQRLAQEYGIKGFPTIKVFPAGPKVADPQDYQGARESGAIVQYALDLLENSGIEPTVPELTSQRDFDGTCGGKRICVLAALPHLMDSGKAGREDYINTIIEVAKKMRGKPFSFFWFEGGAQSELESTFELTFGFPALVAVSQEKGAYAVQRGAFSASGIASFLNGVMIGSQKTTPAPSFPRIVKVTPWDGEDAAAIEEEFSLDELFGDDEL